MLAGVDLLPTFAALAGVSLPDGYQPDGVDLSAALKGADFERVAPLFWERRNTRATSEWWPRYGVQNGQWRMVMNEDGSQLNLYDMREDWAERDNIAEQHPEVVTELRVMLDEWIATLPKGHPDTALSSIRQDLK